MNRFVFITSRLSIIAFLFLVALYFKIEPQVEAGEIEFEADSFSKETKEEKASNKIAKECFIPKG